jgi:uncharacterized membrane protein
MLVASSALAGGTLTQVPKISGLPAPHPYAISADGKTVIGQFAPGNPFVWRGGSTARFRPGGEVLDQYCQAVSADGSVIVGKATKAYQWRRSGVNFVNRPSTFAYGVSLDGSVIVGQEETKTGSKGFIWTGGIYQSIEEFAAICVSGDGKVIAGIRNDKGTIRAFERRNKVAKELELPRDATDSTAFGINKDGTKIVGSVTFASGGTQGAVWSLNKGITLLQNSGMRESVAKCITVDGSWIGGYAGDQAAIWTPDGKITFLEMALRQSGNSTRGWDLESVNGIARVGNVLFVTGWGHLNGKDAGYYATFRLKS